MFRVFLPGNSYRTKAMAAMTPMAVVITAVQEPRIMEFSNARRMVSLLNNFPYHFRLKPSMGKQPNCCGLKESTTTTTMGANMKT